jgi:hypothetical protein
MDTKDIKELNQESLEIAKRLVIEKLTALPRNVRISIGNRESLSPSDLIALVEHDDPLSLEIIAAEINYLQMLGNGELLNEITDPLLNQF